MNFSLDGKIAAITGLTKGLGRAMALALAENGADIVGIGIGDMGEVGAEIRALGRRFSPICANLEHPDSMEDAAQGAIQAFGRVDILVNNAGVTPVYPADSYPAEEFDRVMTINVKSLFLLTQAIGRHMVANRYGRIINIASVQSFRGGSHVSAYVATKHAVAGITRALANEWGMQGITVNAIAPGFMETDNTAQLRTQTEAVAALTAQIPAGRWGTPKDLMGPVVFLASAEASYVNGHLLVVDGGYLNN